uniref:Uncharacterized protein n=1 Tax=Anguilla anguilla TaxID=7936 RepID=A0A0E9P5E5_ANGAN
MRVCVLSSLCVCCIALVEGNLHFYM